jgi:hypothetical protein
MVKARERSEGRMIGPFLDVFQTPSMTSYRISGCFLPAKNHRTIDCDIIMYYRIPSRMLFCSAIYRGRSNSFAAQKFYGKLINFGEALV